VFKIATLNSAKAIGLESHYGSIEKGKKANIIIFNSNPLKNSHNLLEKKTIIKDGVVFTPKSWKYYSEEDIKEKTHWDFEEYYQLEEAQDTAQIKGKPLLIGLFGSLLCCYHLALNQQPYQNIITDNSVQELIESHFVSLLIKKPEAYDIYYEYDIDPHSPALLVISPEGQIRNQISFTDTITVENVITFLDGEKQYL